MIDFIKINFENKEKVKIIIYGEGNFEEISMSYEIDSVKAKYPLIIKFLSANLMFTEHLIDINSLLLKFYNPIIKGKNFNAEKLNAVINRLSEKLPFLKDTQITQMEFGLDFKNPICIDGLRHKTALLCKDIQYRLTYEKREINNLRFKGLKSKYVKLEIIPQNVIDPQRKLYRYTIKT